MLNGIISRRWIGQKHDSAAVKLPFSCEVVYYDNGQWGTLYLGRVRICWTWKKRLPERRPEQRELYISENSTPWGTERLLGRALYIGKSGRHIRVFPNAETLAKARGYSSYAEMRQWTTSPDDED